MIEPLDCATEWREYVRSVKRLTKHNIIANKEILEESEKYAVQGV